MSGLRWLGDCVIWEGRIDTHGYGLFQRHGKMIRSHRQAWVDAHGPIPTGLCVLHRCDKPACVNVEHLFLGTHQTNMADRDHKGHGPRGTRNGRALLTPAKVRQIRSLKGKHTHRALGLRFGVSAWTIRNILSGQTWKHVRPKETV